MPEPTFSIIMGLENPAGGPVSSLSPQIAAVKR